MTHVEKLKKLVEIEDQLGYIAQLLVSTFSIGPDFKLSKDDEEVVDDLYGYHFGNDGSEPQSQGYVNQDGEEDPNRSLYHNDNEDSEGYREDGCPWIYTE